MMMYRYFSGRMMGGNLFGLLLAVLLVVGIVLLIVVLASRKNKTPVAAVTAAQTAAPAAQDRFVTLLNEQKAASGMGVQEYEERRLILEGARSDNHANAEIVSLKERYARGELTTSAYVEARAKLLGLS